MFWNRAKKMHLVWLWQIMDAFAWRRKRTQFGCGRWWTYAWRRIGRIGSVSKSGRVVGICIYKSRWGSYSCKPGRIVGICIIMTTSWVAECVWISSKPGGLTDGCSSKWSTQKSCSKSGFNHFHSNSSASKSRNQFGMAKCFCSVCDCEYCQYKYDPNPRSRDRPTYGIIVLQMNKAPFFWNLWKFARFPLAFIVLPGVWPVTGKCRKRTHARKITEEEVKQWLLANKAEMSL